MPTEHDPDDGEERATLRQKLHWATGDRDAEAQALADDAGDVSPEEAKAAVQRAHGDAGAEAPTTEGSVATPADARAVHDERT